MVGGQVMIIFVGGRALQVERINGWQWLVSIILGAGSLPMGVVIRLIPDDLIRKFIPDRLRRKPTPELVVSDEDQRFEWNKGMLEIRDDLVFIKRLRGGRLNQLKYAVKHPVTALRSRSGSRISSTNSLPQTPVAELETNDTQAATPASKKKKEKPGGRSRSNSAFGAAVGMAGIVAGSVAGWSPIERRDDDTDSIRWGHPRNLAELETQPGVEVHPNTRPEDPVLVQNPLMRGQPPSQNKETTPSFPIGPFTGDPKIDPPDDDSQKDDPKSETKP